MPEEKEKKPDEVVKEPEKKEGEEALGISQIVLSQDVLPAVSGWEDGKEYVLTNVKVRQVANADGIYTFDIISAESAAPPKEEKKPEKKQEKKEEKAKEAVAPLSYGGRALP